MCKTHNSRDKAESSTASRVRFLFCLGHNVILFLSSIRGQRELGKFQVSQREQAKLGRLTKKLTKLKRVVALRTFPFFFFFSRFSPSPLPKLRILLTQQRFLWMKKKSSTRENSPSRGERSLGFSVNENSHKYTVSSFAGGNYLGKKNFSLHFPLIPRALAVWVYLRLSGKPTVRKNSLIFIFIFTYKVSSRSLSCCCLQP